MKRTSLLIIITLFINSLVSAQATETVSTGAGYANQVWYSLANGVVGTSAKNNWDLAFDVSSKFGSDIYINSGAGASILVYPKEDASAWNNVDTAGLSTWAPQWNAENEWRGALGRYNVPGDDFDFGWGKYNMTTHILTGDSVYIVRLTNGEYRKLMIESLNAGVYTFKYSNLDNSGEQQATITGTDFPGKTFAYYSLSDKKSLNREPASKDWDLLFTQYTAFIPGAYNVSGILQNTGIEVAEVTDVDAVTYNDYVHDIFDTVNINVIGYDWKSFNGTAYETKDSTVYFVKTKDQSVWKMVMTGFGGSANGNFIFTKEQLHSASIRSEENGNAVMSIYPNPSNGRSTLVYTAENTQKMQLNIYDLNGRKVFTDNLTTQPGLQQYSLADANLGSGVYVVRLETQAGAMQQKLIVR